MSGIDPRCCWEAELDVPLSAHPQHLLQVRVAALQLFDYATVSALKGLSSLATYLASNGNLINASVFKHHNFRKKVYSAFQIVSLQTDFWNPTPVQVEDFLQRSQTTVKGFLLQNYNLEVLWPHLNSTVIAFTTYIMLSFF